MYTGDYAKQEKILDDLENKINELGRMPRLDEIEDAELNILMQMTLDAMRERGVDEDEIARQIEMACMEFLDDKKNNSTFYQDKNEAAWNKFMGSIKIER